MIVSQYPAFFPFPLTLLLSVVYIGGERVRPHPILDERRADKSRHSAANFGPFRHSRSADIGLAIPARATLRSCSLIR